MVYSRLLKYRRYCRWFKRRVYNNRGKGEMYGDSHYGEQGLIKTAGRGFNLLVDGFDFSTTEGRFK